MHRHTALATLALTALLACGSPKEVSKERGTSTRGVETGVAEAERADAVDPATTRADRKVVTASADDRIETEDAGILPPDAARPGSIPNPGGATAQPGGATAPTTGTAAADQAAAPSGCSQALALSGDNQRRHGNDDDEREDDGGRDDDGRDDGAREGGNLPPPAVPPAPAPGNNAGTVPLGNGTAQQPSQGGSAAPGAGNTCGQPQAPASPRPGTGTSVATGSTPAAPAPTFTRDIAPIAARSCGGGGCHSGSNPAAGIALDSAADWQRHFDAALRAIGNGSMPIGRSRLSAGELTLLQQWKTAGFPN